MTWQSQEPLTVSQHVEIPAQGCDLFHRLERHSPNNGFVPLACHTTKTNKGKNRLTNKYIETESMLITELILKQNHTSPIVHGWPFGQSMLRSHKLFESTTLSHKKSSIDIFIFICDLRYHCNCPPIAWWATANMSSGMVGKNAACTNKKTPK